MEHPKKLSLILPVLFHGAVVIEVLGGRVCDRGDGWPGTGKAFLDEAVTAVLDHCVRASFPHAAAEGALDEERRRRGFLRRVPLDQVIHAEKCRRKRADFDAGAPEDMCDHADSRCLPVGSCNADDCEFSCWEAVPHCCPERLAPMPREAESIPGGKAFS